MPYADEQLYWELALSMSHGEGYLEGGVPSTSRPPGYPLVIAPLQRIAERPILPKVANVLFLVVTAMLVGAIARLISGSSRAVPLSYGIILLFPIVHYSSGTLYPQIFGSMLFALIVYVLIRFPGRRWAQLVAGLSFGLLMLAVPAFLLMAPLLAAYLVWPGGEGRSWRDRLREGVPGVAVFIIATALVLAPWIARNAVVFGKFIPLSTNSGLMLIQGNSEGAGPNSGPTTDFSNYVQEARAAGMNRIETDAFFRRSALAWIAEHPGKALRLYLLKTLNYFNFWNDLATESEVSRDKQVVSFATYYPLLLLAMARLLLMRRFPIGRGELLLLALYLANAPLGAIFYHRIRYRIPFDFLLIAVVAAFLARLLDSGGRSSQVEAPGAAVNPREPASRSRS